MLQPSDPAPPSAGDRPVGELVHQLIEEGKAYARAETALAKAIAVSKARALVVPAALLGGAFLCALVGLTALAVGIVLALATVVGPLLAGLIGLLIFFAAAGIMGWIAIRKLGDVW